MEQSRKNLKILSILILILAGMTLLNIASELFFGDLNRVKLPEGAPENTLLIAKIAIAVVSFLLLLPQLYMGFKGLKMAKKPDSSKAHIIWGTILLVLGVISLISPALAIIKLDNVLENAMELLSVLAEVIVFFEYVRCAKAVSRAK